MKIFSAFGVAAAVCSILTPLFGYYIGWTAAETDYRAKLATAEQQKVLLIEQAEAPDDMNAVNEAYKPVIEPEKHTVDYNGQEADLVPPSESIGAKYIGKFSVSHYCTCALCCGKSDGVTASGRQAIPYYSIAVDPSVIPLGTIVQLDYGDGVRHEARADDTGGAIKGNRVDLCVGDHETAVQYGIRTATVYVGGRIK